MKPIVVRDQVRLSAGRCLYLTLAGMYYRLTRSTITVAIIALAVAFLSYMLAYSVLSQERVYRSYEELHQTRFLGEWIGRLSGPDAAPVIVTAVVGRDSSRLSEYRRWTREMMSPDSFDMALEAFGRYQTFLSHVSAMPPASRAVLLGEADPFDLPRLLCNAEYRSVFLRQTRELAVRLPLGSQSELESFLEHDWPVVNTFIAAVKAGQSNAIEQVRRAAAGRSLVAWLVADAAGAVKAAREAGYEALGAEQVEQLRAQALQTQREELLSRVIAEPQARITVARLLKVNQKSVDMDILTRWLSQPRHASMFIEEIGRLLSHETLPSPSELIETARIHQRTTRLQETLGNHTTPGRRGLAGVPQATRWLIVVSFLVCAVGICNTMFMSVTERFTEIATMKCLGAMDGFMMLMFVFEAIIQGITGGLVGIVVGFVLAAIRGLITYGGLFFESVPWGSLGLIAVTSLALGVGLAAVSAVGPAWMAARLAPMEAMRVE